MRKHLVEASATLALILGAAAGCGGTGPAAASSQASSCVNASAPHHAYVVVQHLSGASVQKCVGFSTDTIDGPTLMDSSKIEYQAQTFSFGKAVCQVDDEPKTYSQCFGQNQPYWALFVEINDTWTEASNGYTQVTVHDKDAMGWHYVQPSDPSPAPPPAAKES
ncbi:MAG TPA: hypothetical protein VLU92_06945 [Candidatus Dormibacteraeota bacterium]|nr:hypothetical protein [Candidatus Dormibacteraeota bacterium]